MKTKGKRDGVYKTYSIKYTITKYLYSITLEITFFIYYTMLFTCPVLGATLLFTHNKER